MESQALVNYKEMLRKNIKFTFAEYQGKKLVKALYLPEKTFTTLEISRRGLFSQTVFRSKLAILTRSILPPVNYDTFIKMLADFINGSETESAPLTAPSCYKER